jgi:CelD/BcsL family acetyltransferase involved in cellulose biosynthesis
MSLALRAWRGLEALAALATAWDELARAAGLDPLCNAHAWTLAYARTHARDEHVFGWTLEQDGAPAGILALRREAARGALALRRALLVADGSFDSDYLDVPVRPGLERELVRRLFEGARGVGWLEAVVLGGVPGDSRFLAALRAELDERGLPRREHAVACLAAPLAETFEPYLAGLKSRMRSKVRSAVRAAGERGARLEWCTRAEELEPWLAELYRLHEQRWRAEGHAGSFADESRRAFYAEFTRAALARGELCFARLVEANGAASALQLGVRANERYYQVQEGYDPAREDERVGTALRGLALAELIARGVRAYDFMAGDSRHKRDWGGLDRPCTTLAFPLPRWRARASFALKARVESWRARAGEPEGAPGPKTETD